MRKLIVFTAFLLLASDAYAQGGGGVVFQAFRTWAKPVGNAVVKTATKSRTFSRNVRPSSTQRDALQRHADLLNPARSTNFAGLDLGVVAVAVSLQQMIDSGDVAKIAFANNFLEATEQTNAAFTSGEIHEPQIEAMLEAKLSSLSSTALNNTAQVSATNAQSVQTRVTSEQTQEQLDRFDSKVDEFADAVKARGNGNKAFVDKLLEATNEMKQAARKGVFVLGDGAASCAEDWEAQFDAQIENLVGIFASTDEAATYGEAFTNLSKGAKDILGISSDDEITRRLGVLSAVNGCRAIDHRVNAFAQ